MYGITHNPHFRLRVTPTFRHMPRSNSTPPRVGEATIELAERDARIVELRRHRLSWSEIADAVGAPVHIVRRRYSMALARIPAQSVDEHRAEEVVLIDDATADLMIIARDPNVLHRTRVEAWSAVRGWAERKAKLLGLDAPTQTITVDLVDNEITKLTNEIKKMEAYAETGVSPDAPEER